MKEIPCHSIDAIEDAETRNELLAYAERYRRKSFIGAVIGVVFFIPMVGFITAAWLAVQIFIFVFLEQIRNAVAVYAGGFLPDIIAGIAGILVSGVIDLVITAPFILAIVISGLLAYQSIYDVVSRTPNVAKRIFIAENPQEVYNLTTKGTLYNRVWSIFEESWNKVLGLMEEYKTGNLMKRFYTQGGVIAKTKTKNMMMVMYSMFGTSVSNRIVVMDRGSYSVFISFFDITSLQRRTVKMDAPEVIAIIEKKYGKQVIDKLREVASSAGEKITIEEK